MGRLLWTHPRLPSSDPFTFGNASARFGDPEWLGDLAFYWIYERMGETGLQACVVLIAGIGYALSLGLGLALGGHPATLTAWLLCTLPAVGPRISARNDLHLLWLLPLFSWLAAASPTQRRNWPVLLGLGWLWANLHSSFLLGAVLLAAALMAAPNRRHWLPWAVAGSYPVLPWLGLSGSSTYWQLLDHVQGASIYRALISEWQSPLSSGGILAILPLHVLFVLGGVSLWHERARAGWVTLTMFVMGGVLAYGSRRFLPLSAALMVPAMGASSSQLAARLPLRLRRATTVLLALCALGYVGLGLRSAAHRPANSVFASTDSPERAARFMAAYAPAGARVANAFNDGPWLAWITAPRIRHYLDPRNNLGAPLLAHYVNDVLANPERFEAEAREHDITLVLIRALDPQSRRLGAYLAVASGWRLIYWDGYHALHARVSPENQQLLARFGYRVLRPRFDLAYLDEPGLDASALDHDLGQLDRQARPLASAVRAYRWLRRGAPGDAVQAANSFEAAIPQLPQAPELLGYWAQSLQRVAAATQTLRER